MSEESATPTEDALGSGMRFFMAMAMTVTFSIFAMQPFLRLPEVVRVVIVLSIFACNAAWVVVGYLRRPGGIEKTGKWLATLISIALVLLLFLATVASALLSVLLFYYLP